MYGTYAAQYFRKGILKCCSHPELEQLAFISIIWLLIWNWAPVLSLLGDLVQEEIDILPKSLLPLPLLLMDKWRTSSSGNYCKLPFFLFMTWSASISMSHGKRQQLFVQCSINHHVHSCPYLFVWLLVPLGNSASDSCSYLHFSSLPTLLLHVIRKQSVQTYECHCLPQAFCCCYFEFLAFLWWGIKWS